MGFGEGKGISSGVWFLVFVIAIGGLFVFFARTDNGYSIIPTISSSGANSDSNLSNFRIDLFDTNSKPIEPVKVDKVGVFFCPRDACAEQLIQKINSADKNIFIAIYSFTHDGISDALVNAKKRGIEIEVVFDYDQSANASSDDEKLIDAGIKVSRRNGSGYMHSKYTIIDGNFVATGSFNYSQNADTRNDENLVFIESYSIAAEFKSDFDHLWSISDKAN
ncbi:MAG: phospholipase D-like domain-containing protein [archaeon]